MLLKIMHKISMASIKKEYPVVLAILAYGVLKIKNI
jgi:hypothetical protein